MAWRYSFHGQLSYAAGLELQERAHAAVLASNDVAHVLGLTHDRVMTLGRNATSKNLLVPEAELQRRGITLAKSDRGGDVTYHGPEQVILYPIVHLERARLHVRTLVCVLEKAMKLYLEDLGIAAECRDGAPGVFAGDAKIGFLGLRIRDGVSTHGLSLNLGGSLEPFLLTHPCGFVGQRVTSVEALTGRRPTVEQAAEALNACLSRAY
jgi:lipoyl(octanoyl) transferase